MANPIIVGPPPLEVPIQDKGGIMPYLWRMFFTKIGQAGAALGNLADLAAQTGIGFATRINIASQWRLRTFQAGSGISISNPAGVAGDPSWSVTGLLLALFNLATTGFLVRTGAGTAATRTLQAGTNITITNADGVAGDPTISTINSGTVIEAQVAAYVSLGIL